MRGKLRFPGRPPGWEHDQRQRFWIGIASGKTSEDVAIAVGVTSGGSHWMVPRSWRHASRQPVSFRPPVT